MSPDRAAHTDEAPPGGAPGSAARGPAGLRERKKAKTRAAIQHQALRLFRQRGYESTTVEQITAAVEVSPSTFFRYFPTKEDVVLSDDYDPLIVETFRAQPATLGPIEAFRRTMHDVFASLGPEEVADMRDRMELAMAVPALRAAVLDQFAQTMRQVDELVAERTGRRPDDLAVGVLAGAILGALLAAEFHWVAHPDTDLATLLDAALVQLQSGLAL